jgi:hypothetical protein
MKGIFYEGFMNMQEKPYSDRYKCPTTSLASEKAENEKSGITKSSFLNAIVSFSEVHLFKTSVIGLPSKAA